MNEFINPEIFNLDDSLEIQKEEIPTVEEVDKFDELLNGL